MHTGPENPRLVDVRNRDIEPEGDIKFFGLKLVHKGIWNDERLGIRLRNRVRGMGFEGGERHENQHECQSSG